MRQSYTCYSFSDVEIRGLHHYIHYMMTDKNVQISLNLTKEQAALLAHAVVEFQDRMHLQSFEDFSIDEDFILQLQNLVDQTIEQTKVVPLTDVSDHAFSA